MQYFKGDDLELKMIAVAQPIMDVLSGQKDLFYADAYEAFGLGELIFDNGRSPLSNAIPRIIFREAFQEIFDAFAQSGTFESYLTVFTKIFGDDVDVQFTVPAPGKLEIDILAAGVELSNFLARHIVANHYVFDLVNYEDGDGEDNIVFQSIKGFQSQYELERMLFEMVPDGIFTEINLTLA